MDSRRSASTSSTASSSGVSRARIRLAQPIEVETHEVINRAKTPWPWPAAKTQVRQRDNSPCWLRKFEQRASGPTVWKSCNDKIGVSDFSCYLFERKTQPQYHPLKA